MKTHKRDKVHRAYRLGYKAGLRGKYTDKCPFFSAERRGSWMHGWRERHGEFRSGYLDLEAV